MPCIEMLKVKQPQSSRACVLSLSSVCHGACVLSPWTMPWAAPNYAFVSAAKLPISSPRMVAAANSVCCCAEFHHIYTSIKESASLKVHWNEELKADSHRYIQIAGPAVQFLRCLLLFLYMSCRLTSTWLLAFVKNHACFQTVIQ